MSLKLVKFKNFLGGAYSAPPNPPAVWARCARLVPPQNLPVPPQLPPPVMDTFLRHCSSLNYQ